VSPLLTCPCGTPVDVDDPPHTALAAAGATVLCPRCDADDVARRTATVDEADAALNAERVHRIREVLDAAGIPQRASSAAIADPPARPFRPEPFQRDAYAWGTQWANHGGILTLAGPMGSGKTTLAARAAMHRLMYGRPVRWRFTADVVAGEWANDDQVRAASEQLLHRGTGALVLDDLDIERTSGAALETLGKLVDRWYRIEQPLLVTTNATPKELASRYGRTGERIASRLKAGPWVHVAGPDLRGRSQPGSD
jgi:DNA replication protein DnaC